LPWSFVGFALAFVPLLLVGAPHAHLSLLRAWELRSGRAVLPALGAMGAALAVALPSRLARRLGLPAGLLAFTTVACFALALPRPRALGLVEVLRQAAPSALFLAIVVAFAVAAIFLVTGRRTDPVARAPHAVVAAAIAFAVFAVLAALHVSLGGALAVALRPLSRLGDGYAAFLTIIAVQSLLWLIGVHGAAMTAAVVTPLYLTLQMQNAAAYAQGAPLPHLVTSSLFLFATPGGAGATLPLAVLLACSRVPRLRRIGRLALVPSLVNANEPLLYGVPVAMNPALALPFLAAPLVLAATTCLALHAGLVAPAALYVPSSVPTPIAVYLATLDPRAIVLSLVNLTLAFAIWWPFVRAYERRCAHAA